MSFTKDVVIYPELRPPVASVDGSSPLRGRRLNNIFKAKESLNDDNAHAASKLIVEKFTDNGLLAPGDDEWNRRHHHSPSLYN